MKRLATTVVCDRIILLPPRSSCKKQYFKTHLMPEYRKILHTLPLELRFTPSGQFMLNSVLRTNHFFEYSLKKAFHFN